MLATPNISVELKAPPRLTGDSVKVSASAVSLLQQGVFKMNTRRFGTLAEIMVKRMTGNEKARSIFHDLYDPATEHRVEVKFSTVRKRSQHKVTVETLFDALAEDLFDSRDVNFASWQSSDFDSKIQQVKCAEFETLYYGLFFADTVLIFRARTHDVSAMPHYSGRQHKGNVGEGQFPLNPYTLDYHLQHHLHAQLSYADLVELLM
jgi:hypothetical protein